MKVLKEKISIEEIERDRNIREIQINVDFTFAIQNNCLDEKTVFQFIANSMKDKIDNSVSYATLRMASISPEEISMGGQKDSSDQGTKQEDMSLSLAEQKVYDYIKGEAPKGKSSEIVWRWPTGDAVIPEDVETFINCTQHKEPRVVRYSYTKRLNDEGKHNFWISHLKPIDEDFCSEDLEADKLVELYNVINAI